MIIGLELSPENEEDHYKKVKADYASSLAFFNALLGNTNAAPADAPSEAPADAPSEAPADAPPEAPAEAPAAEV
jgi:hypothetical protein